MQQKLKQALSRRQKSRIVDDSRMPSAVVIPVYQKNGEFHVLLTKRTEEVQNHKGQISFPGGAYEEEDGTLIHTALRECTEEIGLAPEVVELLGELDDTVTMTSSFIISPFVATIPWPYPLKIDPRETKEIIEVPISALLDENCLRQETRAVGDRIVTNYFYHYQEHVIWGATARILNQFLGVWSEIAKP